MKLRTKMNYEIEKKKNYMKGSKKIVMRRKGIKIKIN
jgi:hypothetical protein